MLATGALGEHTADMVSDLNPADPRPVAGSRADLQIRLAGPASVEDLAQLWVDAEQTRRESEPPAPSSTPPKAAPRKGTPPKGTPPRGQDLRSIRDRLNALIAHAGTIALIARLKDEAAAMTVVVEGRAAEGTSPEPVPGLAHVTMVAVRPDLWGRRYGELVLRQALDRARGHGYQRAQLWTPATNRQARALYDRLGWALTGREQRAADDELLVHYELPLADET